LEKQTMEVFYRAKDPDTVVLIKKFEYELSEVVQDIRQDICINLVTLYDVMSQIRQIHLPNY